MKIHGLVALAAVPLVLAACVRDETTVISAPADPPAAAHQPPTSTERVRMTTTLGDIVLELDRERAPVSVANFLSYVDSGAYNGTIFHRVVENFVIQGGGYTAGFVELPGRGTIRNEWQNGLKNQRGAIAMAREKDPDSATRQFYINVADNTRLDTARDITGNAGYAVFGRVVEGMDVVDRIRRLPVTTRPDPAKPAEMMEHVPIEPPVITRVERLSKP